MPPNNTFGVGHDRTPGPGAALVDIVLLWAAIVATTVAFWHRSILAGVLMVPYLAWVSFAVALNFAIWRLNG